MIDTIKFKVKVSEDQYKLLNEKCTVFQKTKQNETIFRFVTDNVRLGSYERNVHIQVNEDRIVYLEFSAPKYLYGHNVLLMYPSQLATVLWDLNQKLESYFGSFPPYRLWAVQRLDICYAWRLKDQASVIRVMTLLQSFSYPRKDPYTRRTSIMFIGSAYSIKFYQKYDEFKKHDFKELNKENKNELAEKGYILSSGVLRFEASLKRPLLKFHWGDKMTFNDLLDKDYLMKLLKYYFKKYFKNLDAKLMTTKEIHSRLITKYGKTRGVQLFQFYLAYFSPKPILKKLLIESYSRSQIDKNMRDIRKAEVGISKESLSIEFDFNIPSIDVVNSDTGSAAPAAEPLDT